MVRLTNRPDMTIDIYHGHKTTTHQHAQTVILDIRGYFEISVLEIMRVSCI